MALFDLVRRVASDHPAELEMAFSVADIRRIKKTGKMARAGGIVMINVASSFLDQAVVEAERAELPKILPEYRRLKLELAANPRQLEEQVEKLLETLPHHKTRWSKVVDHVEHIIWLAGPDAVGLGTDFDGISTPPEGFEDVSCYPRITEELLRRGFSEEVVWKVLGGNFLHFFSRVEKQAH